MMTSFRMHGATSLQEYLEDVRTRFLAVNAAAAAYLCMSATDLRERLAGGDSLGDMAQFEGKSLDGLRRTVASALRGMPAGGHNAEFEPFIEELAEDLIWVQGGPERLRGSGVG
jgi:hypothetical protein